MADLEDLVPITCEIGGRPLTVVRVEQNVFAFAAYCSHRVAPLVDGAVTRKRTVVCPWHLGIFRLRDGSVVTGPPDEPIRTFPVTVRDGVAYLAGEETDVDAVPAGAARSCGLE